MKPDKKKLTREELLCCSNAALAKVKIKDKDFDDVWKLDIIESELNKHN